MIPTAIYDACVLYPSPLRDLLLRLAIEELVRARWSERILDEVFRNLAEDRPDLSPERLAVTRTRMCAAVLDCLVGGYEALEAQLHLPDPDDRHVLAAAIQARAGLIVTFNLRDFPVSIGQYGITAIHPDNFVCELFERSPLVVLDVVTRQAADLRRPPHSTLDVVAALERCGLPRFGAALRAGLT